MRAVFLNGTMLSLSDKSESVNKSTDTDLQQNRITYFRVVSEVPMN